MPSLFISDLHLAPERPGIAAQFRAFCEGPARAATEVYILGDLFEVWIGDDTLSDPFSEKVAQWLRGVSDAGVRVFLMHGNRDFLLGAVFAEAAGARLVPDPVVADLYGRRTLLLHGDTLCTDDVAYQAFRRQVREPAFQQRFLALPTEVRRQQAAGVRAASETEKQAKRMEIMDVSAATVDAVFREHGYPAMIHGHTHRPATHAHHVDGHDCERWVLADWRDDGSEYLQVGAAGWSRCSVPG